jgi:hypothetical protein
MFDLAKYSLTLHYIDILPNSTTAIHLLILIIQNLACSDVNLCLSPDL